MQLMYNLKRWETILFQKRRGGEGGKREGREKIGEVGHRCEGKMKGSAKGVAVAHL